MNEPNAIRKFLGFVAVKRNQSWHILQEED